MEGTFSCWSLYTLWLCWPFWVISSLLLPWLHDPCSPTLIVFNGSSPSSCSGLVFPVLCAWNLPLYIALSFLEYNGDPNLGFPDSIFLISNPYLWDNFFFFSLLILSTFLCFLLLLFFLLSSLLHLVLTQESHDSSKAAWNYHFPLHFPHFILLTLSLN